MSSARYVIPSMRRRTPRPATSHAPSSSSTPSPATKEMGRIALVNSTAHASDAPSSARLPTADALILRKSTLANSMDKPGGGTSGAVPLSTYTPCPVASTSQHPERPIPEARKSSLRTTASHFAALREIPADTDAARIILALVHDCFVFIDQLYRGITPESLFAQRYFLLS
ncbi:hypothetical protein CPB85DRAFT_1445547 [Mucidula mucida]|nr:hypothetical protein CPB85DRAFT_1445547 [Mucidula mucida]